MSAARAARKRAREDELVQAATGATQPRLPFQPLRAAKATAVAASSEQREVIEIGEGDDEGAAPLAAQGGESAVAAPPAKRMKVALVPAAAALPLLKSPSAGSGSITFTSSPFWSYYPRAVPSAAESHRFYDSLRQLVDPVPGRIFVYGKYHTENRLTKVFARRAGSFLYSGTEKAATGEWPQVVEELYQIAVREQFLQRDRLPKQFLDKHADVLAAAATPSPDDAPAAPAPPIFWDTVLINYYRDGNDSISWHSDKDSKFFPIASFSFGAEREFFIRERPPPGTSGTKHLRAYSGVLASGSLLMMWPGMQERYHHSVPKRKGISTGRVNVTLRLHHRADADEAITARA